MRAATAAPGLARELSRLGGAPPSRVAALLAREPVEGVALAAARARSDEVVAVVERFLRQSRHVRTLVSGHDLERAGLRGAAIGQGLAAARAAVIDSPGAGREAQLAAALAATEKPPAVSS